MTAAIDRGPTSFRRRRAAAEACAVLAALSLGMLGAGEARARPSAQAATAGATVANAPLEDATVKTGLRDHFRFETFPLDDRQQLYVNVGNGNLVLRAHDLHIEGTGLDLDQVRYYSNLDQTVGAWGRGWDMHPNLRTGLTENPDGSVGLTLPEDAYVVFTRNGDGSYTAPTGATATLVKNGDATWRLTFNRTGERYEYAANGQLTFYKDKNNNTIRFSIANGQMQSITDTRGRVTTFVYEDSGTFIKRMKDPANRLYDYVHFGDRLSKYTDPEGNFTRYVYTQDGRDLREIIDARGNLAKLTYDAAHRVTSITRVTDAGAGTGPTTTYTYNAGNTVSTDPRGNRTTYHYDSELRVTRIVDHLGRETSYTWTGNSDLATVTNPAGKTSTASYDDRNNLTSSQSPTGARERYSYDLSGPHPFYPQGGTDAQGNQTNWSYDANGNLTEKSDGPQGQNPVRLTYNTNGTLATATDAKGTVTSYSYDAQGQLTRIDHPAPLGDVSYTYDPLSRVRTETDGKGQVTTYTYDQIDRITKVQFQDGSSVDYIYDANGNRTRRTDNTGIATYTYDALNRPTQEVRGGQTITYAYDAASNLISLNDPGGTVTYEYNQLDQLSALVEPGGARTTFSYDVNGNLTETAYPNTVRLCAGYDDSERLTSLVGRRGACATGTVLTSFGYGYSDSQGGDTDLRTSMTSQYPGESVVSTSYGYDGVNRLTSGKGLGGSFAYAYDANGNITSKTENGVTTTYTHNTANQITNSGYAYDANGNQTASPTLTLAYNPKDQTSRINNADNTYAGTNQWEITNYRGAVLTHNLLGINSRRQGGSTDRYVRDQDGTLVSLRTSQGQRYYYLFDGLGSVVALTDASGNAIATYRYEPYGRIFASTGTITNPWRYASGYHDPATGLTKFGLRYYDPQQNRWTQRDPVEQALQTAGWNDYMYAGDSPSNFTDPNGDVCVPCAIAAGIVIRVGARFRGSRRSPSCCGGTQSHLARR